MSAKTGHGCKTRGSPAGGNTYPYSRAMCGLKPGVIILTVSRGYQSQKMGVFPFNPSLRG